MPISPVSTPCRRGSSSVCSTSSRNLLEQARGTVLIDRPGRFRFDYTDPPQLIVGDGARVWIYDPELAQVTVRDVDAALGSTPAALLTSERPVAEGFRVEELDVGANVDVFALEPRAEDASFTRIRLAFAGGELRRMELVDQFGQTTLLTFHDIRRRPDLPADAFTFTPPPESTSSTAATNRGWAGRRTCRASGRTGTMRGAEWR